MALGKEKHYGPQNRGKGIQRSYGPEQPRGIWKNFSCRTYPAVTNSGTAERRSRRRSRTTRICRGPLPTISAISRIFLPWSKCDITCRFLCHHCSSLNLEAATTGFRWRADRRTLGRSESAPTGIVLERPRGLAVVLLESASGSTRGRTGSNAIRRCPSKGRLRIFRIP